MNHYMDFDPYLIRERNHQMQRELDSLRLREQLREARGSSSASRFVARAVMRRGVMPLLRACGAAPRGVATAASTLSCCNCYVTTRVWRSTTKEQGGGRCD